jgi:hypothetical protein
MCKTRKNCWIHAKYPEDNVTEHANLVKMHYFHFKDLFPIEIGHKND